MIWSLSACIFLPHESKDLFQVLSVCLDAKQGTVNSLFPNFGSGANQAEIRKLNRQNTKKLTIDVKKSTKKNPAKKLRKKVGKNGKKLKKKNSSKMFYKSLKKFVKIYQFC